MLGVKEQEEHGNKRKGWVERKERRWHTQGEVWRVSTGKVKSRKLIVRLGNRGAPLKTICPKVTLKGPLQNTCPFPQHVCVGITRDLQVGLVSGCFGYLMKDYILHLK